jgi:DNA-binding NarL/FixJ family response regulator
LSKDNNQMLHNKFNSFAASSDDTRATVLPSISMESGPRRLIIIEQRAFVLGVLSIWVRSLGLDAEVISVADAQTSLSPDALAGAAMVILGVSASTLPDPWLERQIGWVRANRADIPMAAIVESDEARAIGDAFIQPRLQGYIPVSSSLAVAAAALHLVAAGGFYRPQNRGEDRVPEQAPFGRVHQPSASALVAKLTPRERAVLELLEQGMQNKIIAYRLGLSQSTVKAHVHSIITKLNVRNRTEAAVSSQHRSRVTAGECVA